MALSERGPWAPVVALVVNAFVWGVSWWPFRQLQEQGLHPLWSTAAVYIVAVTLLLAVRPKAWRAFGANGELWLLMLASGLTNVGFNWAVTVGDVVRVVLLFYLMPAWSVLLAWPLLGERPTPAALARLALALLGLVVILHDPGTPFPVPHTLPDLLALVGGFSFALTNILLRRLQQAPAVLRIGAMFTGGALAAIGAGLLGMLQGSVPGPVGISGAGVGIALLLTAGFLAANGCLQYGAARLPAQATSLVMLSEVLFASASSVLLGAAEVSGRTLAGGALVVAAAAWSAWASPGQGDGPGPQSPA